MCDIDMFHCIVGCVPLWLVEFMMGDSFISAFLGHLAVGE